MATNKQAADKRMISFQVTETERDAIKWLAKQSNMNQSEYIRYFLEPAIKNRLVAKTEMAPYSDIKEYQKESNRVHAVAGKVHAHKKKEADG